jgi:predicted O-methyltransferase YrrM|tara:strand:- start:1392 stop:2024 length:633 start_codon:yes stop_codon:yes gene_type:complete
MNNSLRFNPPIYWDPGNAGNRNFRYNRYFYGLMECLYYLVEPFKYRNTTKMIEIGSFLGESTMMFASSFLFDRIFCIDPFEGEEEALKVCGKNWKQVKEEFKRNTSYWKGSGMKFGDVKIHHYEDYSYNVVDEFRNNSIDFIYIDGNHDYQEVKNDILSYLPKLKMDGFIAGHDYENGDVSKAVSEIFKGQPLQLFSDNTWLYASNQVKV